MADPMKIRADDGRRQGRSEGAHEPRDGDRASARTRRARPIPAHFIQNVTATHNGKTVLSAEWGPAVSKNPFLSFKFAGGKPGDKVIVTWIDNKGDKRTDEATIS